MRRVGKAIIRVFLVFVFVIALQEAVRFCYENWSSITIWSKKERQGLEGTLDTLYCGTSLVYDGINPEIMDGKLGTNSFNVASAGQPIIGSYYLLRETAEKNPIKQVYLSIPMPSLLKEEAYLQNYLSAFENLGSWKWKLKYLSAVNKEEVWTAALFYTTQVESYIAPGTIKKNIKNKLLLQEPPQIYGGRGYRLSDTIFTGRVRKENDTKNTWYESGNESRIQEEALIYLERMADFCKEEGIELIFIGMPYPQVYIDGAGDIDGFHRYIQEKADSFGVEFYDFVYYKEREEVFTDEKFKDDHHLNTAGGNIFSGILAEVLQSGEPAAYFYDSVDEF